jgi:hypothetical protein
MIGGDDIAQDDLVISKLLGQSIENTGVISTCSAAIQLSSEDKHPSKGDTVQYIYTKIATQKSTL